MYAQLIESQNLRNIIETIITNNDGDNYIVMKNCSAYNWVDGDREQFAHSMFKLGIEAMKSNQNLYWCTIHLHGEAPEIYYVLAVTEEMAVAQASSWQDC